MVKALFVNPFQEDRVARRGRIYNRTWPPLDLASSAALLQQEGIDAAIVDANAERVGAGEVGRRARGFDKVFVTSSSLDRWQCPHLDLTPFLRVVEAVKREVPEVYVLGSHGTVKPGEMLELTGATAVVRGEPERTVRDIATSSDLSGILGLTLLENGHVVHRPDQRPVSLGSLPLPALSLLPMERYRYEVMGPRFTLFEMSRGCASACTFCLLKTYGTGVRRKPLDNMIREIEEAVTRFGVRHAYFIDLEFTVLRQQVMDLCRHMIRARYPLKWCCQTRLDLVDDELLPLMKQAGCQLIHTGVEAGSDAVLASTNKGLTLDQVRTGIARIKAAGIETACFFMLGFPGADAGDAEDIIRLAKELAPTYPLFHIAAPYPGTRMYDDVSADARFRFSDDSLFPEAVIGPLSLADLRRLTRRAYLRYYLRAPYIMDRLRAGDLRLLAEQARLLLGFLKT